jgi:hypothetical protein
MKNAVIAVASVIAMLLFVAFTHAGEPVYKPDWAACPFGWHASGQFCVENGQGSQGNALPRDGNGPCPFGWHGSGDYCIPSSRSSPDAVRNKGGACPFGWHRSGSGFCVRG